MNLVHSKKRASRRARLSDGRTERTVSRTQSDAYRKRKTREHETDGKATSSTTHTATKRRPAITKGPAEREADEPTREDKDDVGPSARATAGKRASTASTKVRDTVLVCLLFFYSTHDALDDERVRSTDRPNQTVQSGWLSMSQFFCFFNARVAHPSTSSTDRRPVAIRFDKADFFTPISRFFSFPLERARCGKNQV